jgi:hypothetical protein
MSHTVSTLLLRNLHDVFGEIDPARRRAAIDDIFHEDAVFHEPKGIYRGRDEIDRIAGKPPAVAGTDFIIARDGKIASIYLFFDELA